MKLMAQTGGGAEGVVKERRAWWSWLLVVMVVVAVLVILWLVLLTVAIKLIGFDEKIRTFAVAPADFDGDGDLDLVLANDMNLGPVPDPLWWNDGQGSFTDSGLRLQETIPGSHHVSTGDFNGDGREDILYGVFGSGWLILNEGAGHFASGKLIPAHQLTLGPVNVAPGDLDGDGDLDALITVCCGTVSHGWDGTVYFPPVHRAFLNDGAGRLTAVPGSLGDYGTHSVALGDLDSDGDLDAFLGNSSSFRDANDTMSSDEPNTVWLNDGAGRFKDTGQRLGRSGTTAVVLGDLDGDGDLDAFTGHNGPSEVWINDGAAGFSDSDQLLGDGLTRFVFLIDLDGDDDLDALVEMRTPLRGGMVQGWLNDGSGRFTEHRLVTRSRWLNALDIAYPADCAATPADVDGDGDSDIVAGCVEREVLVWLNNGVGNFNAK